MTTGGCRYGRRRFLQAAGGAAGTWAAAATPAERARKAVALLGGMKAFASRDVPHIGKAMESGLGISSVAQIRRVEG